jgi:hypothetical protein
LLKERERALQAIENPAEQAGAEMDGQGAFGGRHGFTDTEAAVLFKDLHCGNPAVKAYDFSGQTA